MLFSCIATVSTIVLTVVYPALLSVSSYFARSYGNRAYTKYSFSRDFRCFLGLGFELVIAAKILLSAFCLKDWERKARWLRQTPRYRFDKICAKYYTYINEYAKYDKKFYFVDLNDKKNKFLFEKNDLNFTVNGDRLLKVKDKEYDYYVNGKNNILKEM